MAFEWYLVQLEIVKYGCFCSRRNENERKVIVHMVLPKSAYSIKDSLHMMESFTVPLLTGSHILATHARLFNEINLNAAILSTNAKIEESLYW